MLEPSAGKGNIAEYIKELRENRYRELDIDCIEIEPELQAILKGKKFRVVHDDFLTYHTYKHYDLIIMNPPFSAGARHLLKAIEVQSISGGGIICILNAETIRNAYSLERQELSRKLKEYGAEIEYYEKAFSESENPTDVEVAVVRMIIPEPERESKIFETLREKEYEEYERKEETGELAESDIVRAFVAQYNRELEYGLRLYDELLELNAKSLDSQSTILMKTTEGEAGYESRFSVNSYVKAVRRKYWNKFFSHPVFYSRLTSNLANKYYHQINRFVEYDFSVWNIKSVQEEIAKSLIKGVEDCIIGLFDKLSRKHSWSEELELENIHYYNGWKTNASWKINSRVIIPLHGFHRRWEDGKAEFDPFREGAYTELCDIEKVLNYLDNGETTEIDISERLHRAQELRQTRRIELKYFEVTFYKKGTCHIKFTNERLLKKLNIYGSESKKWLPNGYGRKRYEEFRPEEQSVIESFEGRESYQETLMESQYYLFEAVRTMPQLTERIESKDGCE